MPDYPVFVWGVDAYDGNFSKRFEVNAIDYPTAVTATIAMITDFEALCLGGVLYYTVATRTDEDETPGALSNRDEGLTFSMDLGAGKSGVLKMPAPVKSVVNPDRTVNLADALVVAFVGHWIGGPFLISDGETATGVIKGVLDK